MSRVQPTEANLIYSVQPLFTSFFAFVLIGETLSPTGFLGAALIALDVFIKAFSKEIISNNKNHFSSYFQN